METPNLLSAPGAIQLQPGQLQTAQTAPMAPENAANAAATGVVNVAQPKPTSPQMQGAGNPQAPLLSASGGAILPQGGATGTSIPQPQQGGMSAHQMSVGTSGQTVNTQPMSVTDIMNTPQQSAAAEHAAQFGAAGTANSPATVQGLTEKYKELYKKVQDQAVATNGGEARSALAKAAEESQTQTTPDAQQQFMDGYAAMPPVLKTIFDNIQKTLDTQTQKQTLLDEFQKMSPDPGVASLSADQMQLLDFNRIMEGTEDDIRQEIGKAGGFATESQVQALTGARNKTLLKKAQFLQDQIQMKEHYVDQIMHFTELDRSEVDKQVSNQLGLYEKEADIAVDMDKAATQNYQDIVKNIGYDGLANSFKGNTQMQNYAESKLGLPKGSLSNSAFLATSQTIGQQQVAATAANTAFDNSLARERLNLDESKFKADQAGGTGLNAGPGNEAYVRAFNNATAGMGAQSAKQAQATFQSYLASGDLQGARDYIVRVATANAPADQQNQAAGRAMALGALSDISMMLAALKAKNVDTNLYTGTLVNVANKLGTTPNPELNAVGSRILQALITYRKGMTGVAFGPQEAKDYEKIFPDYTNTDELNTTKIATLQDALNSNNKAALSFYIGADNYNALFPSLTNDSGGGLNLLEGGTVAPDWGAVTASTGLKTVNGIVYSQQKDGNWYPIQ